MRGYYTLLLITNLLLVAILFFHPTTKRFYAKNKALFLAPLVPMLPFLMWDIVGHHIGWWMFNSRNILGISAFGLPIEEVLFFYIIPFASLCVWVVLRPRKAKS